MLDGAKKKNGPKLSCCGNLMGACWQVPCICNLAAMGTEFWNVVASVLVGGNSPSTGWIV